MYYVKSIEMCFLFCMTLIMAKSNLPKSARKFIRTEKARIRGQFLDLKREEELINALYDKFLKKPRLKKESGGATQEAAKIESAPAELKTKKKNQKKINKQGDKPFTQRQVGESKK